MFCLQDIDGDLFMCKEIDHLCFTISKDKSDELAEENSSFLDELMPGMISKEEVCFIEIVAAQTGGQIALLRYQNQEQAKQVLAESMAKISVEVPYDLELDG